MKTLCSETLKTLINELNRPGSAYLSEKLLRKKLFILQLLCENLQRQNILCLTR